jgi:capsid protein
MNLKFWEWKIRPNVIFNVVKSSTRFAGQSAVKSYDGEKNLGAMGDPIHYILDHDRLRIRAWQAYLESDLAQTILKKYFSWVMDGGLKLDADPISEVLKSNSINLNSEVFNTTVEPLFKAWAESTASSYSKMMTFNEVQHEAFKNAQIGGDVLVVLRYINGAVTVQLIDGSHVQSPMGGSIMRENRIYNGVEIDKTGQHVAYHVRTAGLTHDRIPARSESTGLITAFLVYGNRYRLDNSRGLPIIATSLETLKKIERYKEAAVGSAEERQKIVYQIVHQQFSDGSTPLLDQLAKASGFNNADNDLPVSDDGVALAENVAATTEKMTYNMPLGAELKVLESKNEMFFKEFYQTNADIICGSIEIPPNVAFSMYNDSFSASRAATKDWEHTMDIKRKDFKRQFLQHVYNFWLHIQILTDKVNAPGYMAAFVRKNEMVLQAYRHARFTGSMFPHIDPLKEVKAERAKLGTGSEHIPLTTFERSTEFLNGGNAKSNFEQYAEEIKMAEKLKIEKPVKEVPPAAK